MKNIKQQKVYFNETIIFPTNNNIFWTKLKMEMINGLLTLQNKQYF